MKIFERIKNWRKRRFHTKARMAFEIHHLNSTICAQDVTISELREHIHDLKEIDAAIQDFNFEKLKKEQDDLAFEGFKQIITARQPRRHK